MTPESITKVQSRLLDNIELTAKGLCGASRELDLIAEFENNDPYARIANVRVKKAEQALVALARNVRESIALNQAQ